MLDGSAERESKGLHAWTEKLDLEPSIDDGFRLSDQLVQTLLGHRAVALFVNVGSVSRAWRLPVDQHAKSHGRSWGCRAHDEMKIAGVKTIRDASVGLVQHGGFLPHRPITGQRPIIQAQPRGQFIDARFVQEPPARRRKVLGALIPDIVFWRLQAVPIGGRFDTIGAYRHGFTVDPVYSGLGQQCLNDHFRLFVRTLAETMVPNT